jgi:hypothetical protein
MAPADHRALPPKVVQGGGEYDLWERWHGAGLPTAEPCGACGNTRGNLQVYGNRGTRYPNGQCWDDQELLCGVCGKYTYVCIVEER